MMFYLDDYDSTNVDSIFNYSKQLIDKTFKEIIEIDVSSQSVLRDENDLENSEIALRNKGNLGQIIEKYFFHYECNSDSRADFPDAGVELKVTPFEYKKNGDIRAGERLVLSNISYDNEMSETLYESHLWEKCKLLLLVYYFRDRGLDDKLKYKIKYVYLFTPDEVDLAIIKNDYEVISRKVIEGKAEELSESLTFYLGACTKGATADSSWSRQFYPPYSLAKKRAFCYKNSYMTIVLKKYIVPNVVERETIVKNIIELREKTFAELVIEKIKRYRGKLDWELCKIFDCKYGDRKALWSELVYRMLGIKSNKAEEFQKANVVVKVIRLEENDKIRESMSFPTFTYKGIIQETWETSKLNEYFEMTKFLFVVFKRKRDHYYLKGATFWNMPYSDLNTEVKEGWEKVVDTIKNGVKLTVSENKNGKKIVKNNLPKKSDNKIVHVRPHTARSYHEFNDGTIISDGGSRSNANQLLDGTWMTNHCFWLNNDYILKQIEPLLK